MNIIQILKYASAVSAVVLIISVLLQARSGGLGTVFGGSSGGEAYRSKRGMEKLLFNLTIVSAIVFAVSAIAIAALSV